ncbi:hypothetical protein ATANTOWER_024737, partial [Ataeniobius toweri]|nr:hypothetical protein [Ataeniobius toweri]
LRTALKSSFYEMSEEVSLTPLLTSDILRQQIISRLIRKLEYGLSQQPLDMDFLVFTCRQELYHWEALSRHTNIQPEVV